jgi:Na+/glutamate symporter
MPDLPALEPLEKSRRNRRATSSAGGAGTATAISATLVRAMSPSSSWTSAPSATMRMDSGRSSGTPVARVISTARVSTPTATATRPQK